MPEANEIDVDSRKKTVDEANPTLASVPMAAPLTPAPKDIDDSEAETVEAEQNQTPEAKTVPKPAPKNYDADAEDDEEEENDDNAKLDRLLKGDFSAAFDKHRELKEGQAKEKEAESGHGNAAAEQLTAKDAQISKLLTEMEALKASVEALSDAADNKAAADPTAVSDSQDAAVDPALANSVRANMADDSAPLSVNDSAVNHDFDGLEYVEPVAPTTVLGADGVEDDDSTSLSGSQAPTPGPNTSSDLELDDDEGYTSGTADQDSHDNQDTQQSGFQQFGQPTEFSQMRQANGLQSGNPTVPTPGSSASSGLEGEIAANPEMLALAM